MGATRIILKDIFDDARVSVLLSNDDKVLPLGCPNGSIKVFQFVNNNNVWKQYGQILFGDDSISLSDNGSILVIGASYDDNNVVRVVQIEEDS